MTTAEAYAEARRITRREARNFAWGIVLLPRPKRDAIAALYAFARRVDDLADGGTRAGERRRALEGCLATVQALPEVTGEDPVLVALADTIARYPIPRSALADLVRGGLMDVEKTRYASFGELHEYCRCVAGAVGLACTAVYGPLDPGRAAPLAETLGVALQQINIMRDVAEDWRLGRVYLPQDELARFGVTEEQIESGRTGPAWQALMEHQAERAHQLLTTGAALLGLLDRRSAACVRAFTGIYGGLLAQMERSGFDVFTRRPSLSSLQKLRAVAAG